jgi:hypothetical protein
VSLVELLREAAQAVAAIVEAVGVAIGALAVLLTLARLRQSPRLGPR